MLLGFSEIAETQVHWLIFASQIKVPREVYTGSHTPEGFSMVFLGMLVDYFSIFIVYRLVTFGHRCLKTM